MTRTRLLWFLVGFAIGASALAPIAQQPSIMFGTFGGAPKAVAVDASGNLLLNGN